MTTRRAGWLAMVALALGAGLAAGKSPPDMTPQWDSPAYWDGHMLVHGEVRYHSDAEPRAVQVLEQFSGKDKVGATIAVDPEKVWLEPHPREPDSAPIKLENYDRVFVALAPQAESARVVVYRPTKEAAVALAESCRVIRAIRAAGEADGGLARAVKAGDAVAERYVFRVLLAKDAKEMAEPTVARVRAVRGDPAVDIATRMLASAVLARRAAAQGDKSDDWDWAAGVLRQETAQDLETMRAVVQHLVLAANERVRTIDLICELAMDKEGPSRRRAAVLAGNIADVLGGGEKDAANEKLVKLCTALVADETPIVRTGAGYALWQMSSRLAQGKSAKEWMPLEREAVAALRKAEETEVGDDMKAWMGHDRAMIGEMVGEK